MSAPKGPEQLHTTPTLIGAPVAWAEPAALPDGLLVEELPEVDLLLEEQAPTAATIASAPMPHKTFRLGITL
jgi:hypothetical protein